MCHVPCGLRPLFPWRGVLEGHLVKDDCLWLVETQLEVFLFIFPLRYFVNFPERAIVT